MASATERRRYYVTSTLVCWIHAQNHPYYIPRWNLTFSKLITGYWYSRQSFLQENRNGSQLHNQYQSTCLPVQPKTNTIQMYRIKSLNITKHSVWVPLLTFNQCSFPITRGWNDRCVFQVQWLISNDLIQNQKIFHWFIIYSVWSAASVVETHLHVLHVFFQNLLSLFQLGHCVIRVSGPTTQL